MTTQSSAVAITQVIQLAIAPVFLLSAVGALIGSLTTFLTRTVDRIRLLEASGDTAENSRAVSAESEIEVLKRRLKLIFLALILNVTCAILIGALIVTAFLDAFLGLNLSILIALEFAAAMLCFIGSLVVLLRGTFLAITRVVGFVARPK